MYPHPSPPLPSSLPFFPSLPWTVEERTDLETAVVCLTFVISDNNSLLSCQHFCLIRLCVTCINACVCMWGRVCLSIRHTHTCTHTLTYTYTHTPQWYINACVAVCVQTDVLYLDIYWELIDTALQHTTTHYSTLQHTVTHSNTLQHPPIHSVPGHKTTTLEWREQCVAVRCSALQCVAVWCSTWTQNYHASVTLAVRCSVLQCIAPCCSALQCVVVCCSVLQCFAVCLQCVAVSAVIKCVVVYGCVL